MIEPIEDAPKLTEAMVRQFEENNQWKLPDDYRHFLLRYNGGFPTPNCVEFLEDGRRMVSDVFCLHGVGDERPWASLPWHQETFAGRLPKNTLAIGHDSCGNLWLLNVASDHSGTVVFWDHGSFNAFDETDFDVWPRVAKSFQEFMDQLHEYQPLPDDEEMPSRYALVRKAFEGMRKKASDFDKRAMLDGAWHCHYSEDGKLTMQCVQYAIHAVVTHTDGYSHLRSARGLIGDGPPRLPE